MSEWISVEDRLPEYDFFPVLVAVCPPAQMSGVHMAYLVMGEWIVIDEKGNHKDFITHWMLLPEPPKN